LLPVSDEGAAAASLWRALTPEASEKLRKGNDEGIFDEARRRVRAWEKAHLH
jgi:hypothetical protein